MFMLNLLLAFGHPDVEKYIKESVEEKIKVDIFEEIPLFENLNKKLENEYDALLLRDSVFNKDIKNEDDLIHVLSSIRKKWQSIEIILILDSTYSVNLINVLHKLSIVLIIQGTIKIPEIISMIEQIQPAIKSSTNISNKEPDLNSFELHIQKEDIESSKENMLNEKAFFRPVGVKENKDNDVVETEEDEVFDLEEEFFDDEVETQEHKEEIELKKEPLVVEKELKKEPQKEPQEIKSTITKESTSNQNSKSKLNSILLYMNAHDMQSQVALNIAMKKAFDNQGKVIYIECDKRNQALVKNLKIEGLELIYEEDKSLACLSSYFKKANSNTFLVFHLPYQREFLFLANFIDVMVEVTQNEYIVEQIQEDLKTILKPNMVTIMIAYFEDGLISMKKINQKLNQHSIKLYNTRKSESDSRNDNKFYLNWRDEVLKEYFTSEVK